MPSLFREPKTLPEWLELDYYRRESGLRRLKRLLVAGALLVPLVAVTAAALVPHGRQIYQAGPVSSAHAQFADQCGRCHTEAFGTAGRFLGDGGRSSVSDDACRRCHGAHPHYAAEGPRPTHCVECHHEHRGRPALAQVADGRCTACHADPQRAGQVSPVPNFGRHPEFALWKGEIKDPGRLNFSHEDHLPEFRMRAADPEGPLARRTLACGDCHQPDAAGAFMQPIRYEKHCAECHQLRPPIECDGQDESVRKALQALRQTPIPHPGPGQSAETVRGVLRDRLTRLAREQPGVLSIREAEPERPIPGDRRAPPVSPKVFRWVDEHLNEAERVFFDKKAGCLLCHQELGDPRRRPRGLPVLALPNVPERWFSHGTFSHKSHQVSDCAGCHKGVKESRKAEDVLMPRLEDCRTCHGAGSGVRSDCVTCHAYHEPEEKLRGVLTLERCRRYDAELLPRADGRSGD